jgi:hypothetical protein
MAQIAVAHFTFMGGAEQIVPRKRGRRPSMHRLRYRHRDHLPQLSARVRDEQLRFHPDHDAAALINTAKVGRTNSPG